MVRPISLLPLVVFAWACEGLPIESSEAPDAGRFQVDLGSAPLADAELLDRAPGVEAADATSIIDAAPFDSGPHPDAEGAPDATEAPYFAPDRPGPYAVGVKTVTLEDPTRDRSFQVDIWYPVDANTPAGAEERIQPRDAQRGEARLDEITGPS
jgi:hypothetical protein